jgi:hypothetical protein
LYRYTGGSHKNLAGTMENATKELASAEAELETLGSFSPDVSDALGGAVHVDSP